jgi:hypothetical protein
MVIIKAHPAKMCIHVNGKLNITVIHAANTAPSNASDNIDKNNFFSAFILNPLKIYLVQT